MRDRCSKIQLIRTLLFAIVLAGCGQDSGVPTETTEGEGEGVLGSWVRSAGVMRFYTMHLPTGHDSTKAAPLLILFHGAGDTGRNFQSWVGMDSLADSAGFITVYPEGLQGLWGTFDAQFVHTLIDQISAGIAVDSNRIYIAGLSMGAELSHFLACVLADRIAGAASVAATMADNLANGCSLSDPVSFIFVHGTLDRIFPWNGRPAGGHNLLSVNESVAAWVRLNGCSATAAVDSLADVVDDSTSAWREVYSDCNRGVGVTLYGVEGGGHTWPGAPALFPSLGRASQDFSASAVILDFFSRHPRS